MRTIHRFFGLTGLALTLVATPVAAVNGQTFLTDGLVGYFPFNGNANDESGNGNDGIVFGATLGKNRFGISGNSYFFTATGDFPTWTGDYITTSHANGFPSGTQDFSVSLWVSLSEYGPDYHLLFANKENNMFQLGISVFSGTKAAIEYYSGLGRISPNAASAPLDWSLGTWYNIQIIRAANLVTIYRNGVSLIQATVTSGNTASPANLNLDFGWRTKPGAGNHPLRGQMDDIRIYNRGLPDSEAKLLYKIESGPQVSLIKAVKPSFDNLVLGTNYQLQVSSDFTTWTDQGTPFPATGSSMIYPQYWDVANWSELFFRLQVAP